MQPRKYSQTGFESIILRGIARGNIFRDDNDRTVFIEKLFRFAEECRTEVIGYALNKNYVRLQLKVSTDKMLSIFVKKLCISYVRHYFNIKYDRNGSLFQNRFINEGFAQNEVVKVNKMIIDSFPSEKRKQTYLETSLPKTLEAYDSGRDLRLNTSYIREQFARDEYLQFIFQKADLELPKCPYTPNMQDIVLYLKRIKRDYGSEYGLTQKQIRTAADSLRRNKVTIKNIARVLNLNYCNIKRCLC